jgi:hypothetical protein
MFNHEFIGRNGGESLLNWGWNRIKFALFETVGEESKEKSGVREIFWLWMWPVAYEGTIGGLIRIW